MPPSPSACSQCTGAVSPYQPAALFTPAYMPLPILLHVTFSSAILQHVSTPQMPCQHVPPECSSAPGLCSRGLVSAQQMSLYRAMFHAAHRLRLCCIQPLLVQHRTGFCATQGHWCTQHRTSICAGQLPTACRQSPTPTGKPALAMYPVPAPSNPSLALN
jgi:hypothetical protein